MNAQLYFEQGVQKSLNKDYLGAIKDYTIAIKLSSSVTPDTITEKHPEGYTSQVKVYNITKGSPTIYFNRGLAYFNIGDYISADSDFSMVIGAAPDDAEAYFWRAKTNYCVGNDIAVKADLEDAYKLDSKYTSDFFLSQFQS